MTVASQIFHASISSTGTINFDESFWTPQRWPDTIVNEAGFSNDSREAQLLGDSSTIERVRAGIRGRRDGVGERRSLIQNGHVIYDVVLHMHSCACRTALKIAPYPQRRSMVGLRFLAEVAF